MCVYKWSWWRTQIKRNEKRITVSTHTKLLHPLTVGVGSQSVNRILLEFGILFAHVYCLFVRIVLFLFLFCFFVFCFCIRSVSFTPALRRLSAKLCCFFFFLTFLRIRLVIRFELCSRGICCSSGFSCKMCLFIIVLVVRLVLFFSFFFFFYMYIYLLCSIAFGIFVL